jgi:hypothetical protein
MRREERIARCRVGILIKVLYMTPKEFLKNVVCKLPQIVLRISAKSGWLNLG